jgi:hypothetical protein
LVRFQPDLSRFSVCLERDFFAYCSSNLLFGALQVNKFVALQGIIFNFHPTLTTNH